jgi:hypothetical protein
MKGQEAIDRGIRIRVAQKARKATVAMTAWSAKV